ncbi:helix-turn-helix transcriptional regulator [Legionella birminghamensis]|nr:helix-turn-helix transcriptional regulator [Legionella birminghamensis]
MNCYKHMKMYTSYLKGCYQHIFDRTVISDWGYLYFDLQGRYLQIISDSRLMDVFLDNEFYAEQIVDNLSHDYGHYYSCDVLHDNLLPRPIQETLVDNKYGYFFDIANHQSDYTEIYTFAARCSPLQASNFTLNNLEMLKLISEDLGKRCRKLLTRENTMILPADFIVRMNELSALHKDSKMACLKDVVLGNNQAKRLQSMVNDEAFDFNLLPFNFISNKDLTQKEREMIYLYYFGFNFQRIADILDISKRTVDKHFENIKRKLDCESTGHIIPHLLRTNRAINDFIRGIRNF